MYGIGISENIPLADQVGLVKRAAELGYESAWCNESRWRDGFMTCQAWSSANPSLHVGIAVVPVLRRMPVAAALQTATLAEVSRGKFILGLGAGSLPDYARMYGVRVHSPITLLKDYVEAVRGYLRGEKVEITSEAFQVHGDSIGPQPLPRAAPVYLAALGPRMTELCGEVADGVLLNWGTLASIAEARSLVAQGAARAGRNAREIGISGYIRVSVDEDPERARAAMAAQASVYALIPPYRRFFEGLGFKEIIDALPGQPAERRFTGQAERMLREISVYGTADEVREQLKQTLPAFDHPIIRAVPARPGIDSLVNVLEAAAPVFS